MEESSLSIVGLIFSAGLVVQLVMVILVLMSIYSWTVIMSKKKILLDASNDVENFHQVFEREEKLSVLYKNLPPLASDRTAMEDIFGSGYKEFTHTKSTSSQALIMNSERAYRSMNTSASNEIDRLDSSLSILAMIASSSPYIWSLWNRLGNYALFHWPCLSEASDYCNCCTRYCRSSYCNRFWIICCYSSNYCLQPISFSR